jgi:membrane-associated phospholipid phosphatase
VRQPSLHPSLVQIARIISILGHPLLILSLSAILIAFYRFGLLVLSIGVMALYFVPGARSFLSVTLFAFLMLASSAVINMKVKLSLHTSVVAYLGISFYSINVKIAIGLLLFGILVAMSRLILKRHTTHEVLIGSLLGIIFGLLHLITATL